MITRLNNQNYNQSPASGLNPFSRVSLSLAGFLLENIMRYKSGTKVFCYIGTKPTEVSATIQDCSHLKGFVDMRGKSLVKFDKPVKLGDRLITSTTMTNSMISTVKQVVA